MRSDVGSGESNEASLYINGNKLEESYHFTSSSSGVVRSTSGRVVTLEASAGDKIEIRTIYCNEWWILANPFLWWLHYKNVKIEFLYLDKSFWSPNVVNSYGVTVLSRYGDWAVLHYWRHPALALGHQHYSSVTITGITNPAPVTPAPLIGYSATVSASHWLISFLPWMKRIKHGAVTSHKYLLWNKWSQAKGSLTRIPTGDHH